MLPLPGIVFQLQHTPNSPPLSRSRFRVFFRSISSHTGPLNWVRPCWLSVRTNRFFITVRQGLLALFAIRKARALGCGGVVFSLSILGKPECPRAGTLKWNTPCQGVSKFGRGAKTTVSTGLRECPLWPHSCQSRWPKMWKSEEREKPVTAINSQIQIRTN